IYVGWNPGFSAVAIDTTGNASARTYRSALLVGYATFSFSAVNEEASQVDIAFREESPWSMIATPRATAPAQWDPQWQPNWRSQPDQDLSTLSRFESLGNSRERLQIGKPGA
ncbi:hypothetical protein V6O07_14700, partial [Arthrospira platensis SPKY2]